MANSNQWPLDQRIRRQLDADAQHGEPVHRGHRDADVRFGPGQLGVPRPRAVERGQLVAEPLHVGGVENRSAGGDDRAGLRALRGHVQPVAVPAVVGIGELTAVDEELEVSQLDGGRLGGGSGRLRHGAS